MSMILAIDLGKFKSVACKYQTATGEHTFQTLPTSPTALHDLIVDIQPTRVVIEIGSAAGWIKDLCEALNVSIEVANPNHEAWRWKNIKRKTDKDDALKLAQLSVMGQLPTVTLPSKNVRQWRSFIAYRRSQHSPHEFHSIAHVLASIWKSWSDRSRGCTKHSHRRGAVPFRTAHNVGTPSVVRSAVRPMETVSYFNGRPRPAVSVGGWRPATFDEH
ncbi:transposase [Phycisphaerales bacterium AB-hyl4]|uniref:Transposase n=1 Tax=Natronomicrosphaera hydrolytica TaxID=3242702 RepID=A0ABV4U8X4_9BACT